MGRITLAVGQVLDTVQFLENVAIINIGAFGSNMVGNLSIITFVKNAFISISATFGIWDASKTINATCKKLSTDDKYNKTVEKLKAWKNENDVQLNEHLSVKHTKYRSDVTPKQLKSYKISKYKKMVSNSLSPIKKGWVAIAADASKLAIVVISSIALMLIVTAPVALVVVGACGLISASLSLFKTMYSQFPPNPKVPENKLINQGYVKVAQ